MTAEYASQEPQPEPHANAPLVAELTRILRPLGAQHLIPAILAVLPQADTDPESNEDNSDATRAADLLKQAALRLVDPSNPAPRIGEIRLSQREQQVLNGMSRGLTNSQIGRELYLAEDSVKTHARRLYQKLEIHDRAGAVNRAWEHGLLGGGR